MPDDAIDLQDFFVGAVNGVTTAQRYLELRRIEGRSLNYSIPRTSMSAAFSFRHDAQQGSIFTGRRNTAEETGFQLSFALLATPNVPPAPPSVDGSNLQSVVSIPWFLVRDSERDELAGELIAALQSLAGVTVDIPGQSASPAQGQFDREVTRIQKTLDNDHGTKPDDSIGVVALALDDSRAAFLIVRLGKHPEGIFILRREPSRSVTVYSYFNRRTATFFYKPLRLTVAALRTWLAQGQPGIAQEPEALPEQLGPVPTSDVTREFWLGQANARKTLHEFASGPLSPSAQLQTFYKLVDVTAALTYTVPPDAGGDVDVSLVRSEVNVTPRDPDAAAGVPARADLALLSPDYVVTGAGREALLDMIQGDVGHVVGLLASSELFPKGTEDQYAARLADKDSRKDVVIVLSYEDRTPVNHFLAIWPAALEDQQREFAFRLTITKGAIKTAEFFWPVEDVDTLSDPVPQPPHPLDTPAISEDGYVGFHDFLHAIRIWNLASRPSGANSK